MNSPRLVAALVGFVLLDLTISALLLGFYHADGATFSRQTLVRQLEAKDVDLRRCGTDFVVIAAARATLLFAAAIVMLVQRRAASSWLQHATSAIVVSSASYAILKLLLFAENSEQLAFVGLYAHLVWTALASAALYALWTRLAQDVAAAVYGRSKKRDDAVAPSDAGDSDDVPADRASALDQIWRLLSYARYNGRYFLLGFAFLSIHSVCE